MKKVIWLTLLLTACSGGNNPPPPSPYPGRIPPDTEWATYGSSSGIIARLPNPFQVPAEPKSVNYVYTAPMGLAVNKTMTLNYTLTLNGVLGVADRADVAPATIALFIWGNVADVNADRWWCRNRPNLAPGNNVLSCVIDNTWSGVNGQAADANFTAAVANPFAMGFTWGGQYFAGHGVWTTSGSATFKVNSFTVQ